MKLVRVHKITETGIEAHVENCELSDFEQVRNIGDGIYDLPGYAAGPLAEIVVDTVSNEAALQQASAVVM